MRTWTKLIHRLFLQSSRKDYYFKCNLGTYANWNPINKPGKKRLVFDAAHRNRGVCLYDMLLKGPDLLLSFPGIIFRFRERAIAKKNWKLTSKKCKITFFRNRAVLHWSYLEYVVYFFTFLMLLFKRRLKYLRQTINKLLLLFRAHRMTCCGCLSRGKRKIHAAWNYTWLIIRKFQNMHT